MYSKSIFHSDRPGAAFLAIKDGKMCGNCVEKRKKFEYLIVIVDDLVVVVLVVRVFWRETTIR